MSWPGEGDGKTVSVVSSTRQRISGDLTIGKQIMVAEGKKQYPAIVHATGNYFDLHGWIKGSTHVILNNVYIGSVLYDQY